MRFSVTPDQATELAVSLGRAAPGLTRQMCLEATAQIAGYRSWSELTQGTLAANGPALPLHADLALASKRYPGSLPLLKQAYKALLPLRGCSPVFDSECVDLLLPEFLEHAGFAVQLLQPCGRLEPRPDSHLLPQWGSPFYQLALTDVADKMLKGDGLIYYDTDTTFTRVHHMTIGAALPPDVEAWLAATSRVGLTSKNAFRQLALNGPEEPEGLWPTADGDSRLVQQRRCLVLAETHAGTIKGALICDLHLVARRTANRAILRLQVHEGLFPAARHELWFDAGGALQLLVEEQLGPMVWAMLGRSDAQLEVYVEMDPAVDANDSYRQTQNAVAVAAELLYDTLSCGQQWQDEDDVPGIHLYRGEEVPLRTPTPERAF